MTLSPFKSQVDRNKTTFIQVNRLLAKLQGKPSSLDFVEYEGCWESHKSAFNAVHLVLVGTVWQLLGSVWVSMLAVTRAMQVELCGQIHLHAEKLETLRLVLRIPRTPLLVANLAHAFWGNVIEC